jgi:quinol monooxygenase YgiN
MAANLLPAGRNHTVEKVALWVMLKAKQGKESEVAEFLKSAVPLVEAEPDTISWFALQIGPSTFGIFDTFPDDTGRQAHLSGKVAAALVAKAPELLSEAPSIQKVDLLAVKAAK